MLKIIAQSLLVIVFILNFSATYSYTPSPERKLADDLKSIPFRSSPEVISEILKKYDSENYNLIRVAEGYNSQKLTGELGIKFMKLKENLYDEDFSLIKNPDKTVLVLNHIRDFTLSDFFEKKSWNPLMKKLRLTFYQNRLYEKEFKVQFPKAYHALTVISVLKKHYGRPKIADSEIHYQGYNRFVWENQAIKVEFRFQPSKNQFSQKTGFQGTLAMTEKSLASNAYSHLSKIKTKLRKTISSPNSIF